MGYSNQYLSPAFAEASFGAHLPRLHRIDGGGLRVYYERTPDGIRSYINSSAIVEAAWQSPYLKKWQRESGEEGETYCAERAVYGTALHALKTHLWTKRPLLPDQIPATLLEIMQQSRQPITPGQFDEWEYDLGCDLLAIAQWMVDRQVEPLLLETALCSRRLGYATVIDDLSWLTWNKKRILALTDLKSKRSGQFGKDKVLQLLLHVALVREIFPHLAGTPIFLFNIAPKDWRGETPTYHFVNQTDAATAMVSEYAAKMTAMGKVTADGQPLLSFVEFCCLQYFQNYGSADPLARTIHRLRGPLDFTNATTLRGAFDTLTLAEALAQKTEGGFV